MMKVIRVFVSWFVVCAFAVVGSSQTIAEVRRGFETPPADSRIMMRWWWFGPAVTKAELERELRVMKAGGIGGVEVQPVYPLLPDDPKTGHRNIPYLSDEFLDMLKFTAQKTKELGMRFDLTLGSGWSFGGAKTPITEAAGQLRVERVKVDVGATRIPLPSIISAEKLMAVFLSAKGGNTFTEGDLKEVTDIRDDNVFLASPGVAGSEVIFFIAGKSGMQVKRPSIGSEGYVLNHLDKPSVDNYLKLTGDRLFEKFAKDEVPYSVFCDSLEVYNQDWTDDFLAEFQKRRGYDLKPHLPALMADVGPKTGDVRYDWGKTITELFDERFMVPMQLWSKANGTKFRIQGYGIPAANISSNKWADISDGEGAQWKVVRAARWAASANHIYGRSVTSSETWTWLNSPVFRATPLDLKAEADIHFLQGINQLIGHGWGYTPPYVEYPGWRFYAAGAYSEQNPWWIVMPDLAVYLQRLSYLLRQGTPQNDVALYMPTADAYAHFSAGRVHLIESDRELVGEKIMPAIFEAGYNVDFFDDEVLRTVGKSANGVLSLGASKHKVVVLPGIDRMPIATLRKLDEFVKGGGKLVATRRFPGRVPGLKATEVEQAEFKSIITRLSSNASVKLVDKDEEIGTALRSLLQPDAEISPSAKDFGVVHRQIGDDHVYFLANTSNQTRKVNITFRIGSGQAEIWDAHNGRSYAAEVVSRNATSTTIALEFAPYGSDVVVFTRSLSNTARKQAFSAADSTLDLSSDWDVSIGQNPRSKFPSLVSWADNESNRYYSGTAAYEKSFEVPVAFLKAGNRAVLDFGDGQALDPQPQRNGMRTWYDPPIREAANIYVNGQKAGSLWCPPYKLDVTNLVKSGRNEIRVVVANTAINYMAGRKLPDYKLLNLRYGERFQPQEMEKIQVLPSGLIGTLKIVSMK
jgi:hypothetical protein